MSRPSPTSSFGDGPSFDSGIGMNMTPPNSSSEPSQVASPEPTSPSNHPRIPYNKHASHQAQGTQNYSRHISSEYSAFGRLQSKSALQDQPRNSLDMASGVPLPLSRPASAPGITLNGRPLQAGDAPFLRRSQTPHPLRKVNVAEHGSAPAQNIERVLGPPKGRKTPTLTNAPKLQWDFTRPFLITPSTSTLGSRVSEGKEEDGCEVGGTITKVERVSTPIPEFAHVRNDEAFRQDNASPPIPDTSYPALPRASCPSHMPTLLQTLDATLTPQPHRLSPLSEVSESLTEMSISHPGPYTARSGTYPFTSSSRPGNAQKCVPTWQSELRNQAFVEDEDDQDYEDAIERVVVGNETIRRIPTRETDPLPFLDTLGLRTAEVLPVTRVTHDDVLRSEIFIERPPRAVGEVVYDEDIGMVRERGPMEEKRQRKRERRERKERSGGRMKRIWSRVKGWFCKKGRREI